MTLTMERGHSIVTADSINPVAVHLSAIGYAAGYDHTIRFLAASIAADALESLDYDVEALVAHYHEVVADLTERNT